MAAATFKSYDIKRKPTETVYIQIRHSKLDKSGRLKYAGSECITVPNLSLEEAHRLIEKTFTSAGHAPS